MTAAQCTPPHPYTHTPAPSLPFRSVPPLREAGGAGAPRRRAVDEGWPAARAPAAPRAGMHEAHEHLLLDERWDGATAEHYAVAALLVLVLAVAGGAIVAYLVALSAVRRQKKGE